MKLLLCFLGFNAILSFGLATVIPQTKLFATEIENLADTKAIVHTQEKTKDQPFVHNDEDRINNKESLKDLKSDVEILESNDLPKETNELEEQFRGNADLKIDTNTFIDENIEMISDDAPKIPFSKHHLFTTICIIAVAIISISIYAILVIWRSQLEQRYGMRELLVTDDFDEYYRQLQRHESLPYLNSSSNEIDINSSSQVVTNSFVNSLRK